ncbi:MAG TPA: ATP-grasp domain-containing protein [Candidatus Cybelea sp.]|jgi:carbamoyl-phosphate synthase large subunit|nr:ATP-grasp domain-containing protein [Candidatus Cybelea sp.]
MITACGTVTAQSVIKALREDGRVTFVAGGDMDPLNATRAFVDEFVPLPAGSSPEFAAQCAQAARRLRIDLLVPIIVEREFLPLDDARALFDAIGCRLALPSREIVLRTGDKLEFAAFLDEIGVPGPRTQPYREDLAVDRFPVYLKPQRGSGSVGTARIESLHSLHEAARGRRDLIVQDAVEGTEFTVDCFAAAPGRVVAAVPRERIAIKAGVSVKGRTYRHPQIESIVRGVVEKSGLTGPANVQGMLCADGSFSIIEMNPRFSGTLALTTAAGINFASLLIDTIEGRPVPDLVGRHKDGLAMMRYWNEVFEERDGSLRLGTPLQALRRDDTGLPPKLEAESRAHEGVVEPLGATIANEAGDGGDRRQSEAHRIERPKVGS